MIDVNKPIKLIDLILVKRAEWGALPAKELRKFESYPIYWAYESFTETEECFSREECIKVLQQIQKRDMDLGLPDIRYNFIVGGDWTVYEGRGWKYIPDLIPYEKVKNECVEVAYIGPQPYVGQINYPILEVKHARQRIFENGINLGYLDSNFNDDSERFHINVSRKHGFFKEESCN